MVGPRAATAPLRLGIVGYGWVARDYFAPAVEAHSGLELVAVVSPRQADFEGLRQNIKKYYGAVIGMAGRGEAIARESNYCEIDQIGRAHV